ncbi:MAG: geranylgeranylglyceryl/heptaprenylglyceryl phosphate synthase [Flavobacteriales bacterium]|nr:geranylgeranylglyceryl/heptaprenylglyceryl phosphate synthase [Flavobacteriales bacterium]
MKGLLSDINASKARNEKQFALLIDPDSYQDSDQLIDTVHKAEKSGVDFLLFGGSLITKYDEVDTLKLIKDVTSIPVILFPSSPLQIDNRADGILFLSLISGRNPEYLIGHHVNAAPLLKNSDLEVLPTGYLLIECGKTTTVEYVSNTKPIPFNKPNIASCTALAGEFMGQKLIYLDGGSGADRPISPEMISEVSQSVTVPIIVGGGIRTMESAIEAFEAGADILVVGNGAEEYPDLIAEMSAAKKQFG